MRRRRFLRSGLAVGVSVASASGVASTSGGASAYTSDRDAGDSRVRLEPLGRRELPRAADCVVDAAGDVAYVATIDGYATVDVSDPLDPQILAARTGLLANHSNDPMELVWDVSIDGDELLVVGPAQHRPRTVSAALHVDVSDPADPERIAVYETGFPIHNCDIADGIAYLTGNGEEGNPVVVVDLRSDPPTEIARWSVLEFDPGWGAVRSPLRPIHDVAVHDGIAYAAYWDAGTHLLDVSDPAAPVHLTWVGPYDPDDLAGLPSTTVQRERTTLPGNHHRAAPNEDGTLVAVNAEAWAVELEDGTLYGEPGGVQLYDLTAGGTAAPGTVDPELLATIDAPLSRDPTYGGVWTTSHNFELRDDRLYTSWYEGGVRVHDVSDPTAPRELGWWRDDSDASIWTAQAGVPGEFFVATSTDERDAEPALYTFPDPAPATPTPDPPGIGQSGPAEDSVPGLGVATGLAAIGGGIGAAVWRLRRRGRDRRRSTGGSNSE